MKLKKFYVQGRHDGYPFDRQKKQYFTWGFDIQAGGKRYQERGYVSKQHAEDVIIKIKADAKNQRHSIRPTAEVPFLIELLQAKLNTMTGPDRSRAKRVFALFLELLPKEIKVTDLRSIDFEKYIQRRLSDGVSAATIRRELVPLVTALHKARKFSEALQDYRPPIIDRPPISKTRRDKVINSREESLIFNHLTAPRQLGETERFAAIRLAVADLLQFQLLTASRPGEIASLTKSDVNLFANTVRIRHTKTQNTKDTTGFLPITPTMKKILARRFAASDGELLFTPNGKITPAMRRALKEACQLNGIKFGKHEFDGITFHTARHTATTELEQAGISLKTIGAFTGHSDENMTLYYSHVNPSNLDKAAAILEQKRGGDYCDKPPITNPEREEIPSIVH